MAYDSTGKPIRVGSKVKFRGREYTIKQLNTGVGSFGTSQMKFEEEQHTAEVADETSVDLISF